MASSRVYQPMSVTATDQLLEKPPSAKLVFWILYEQGPLNQSEISERSLLCSRTIRYAISRLEEDDFINKRVSTEDPRKRIYDISETGERAVK